MDVAASVRFITTTPTSAWFKALLVMSNLSKRDLWVSVICWLVTGWSDVVDEVVLLPKR